VDYEVEGVNFTAGHKQTWKAIVEAGVRNLKIKRKTLLLAVNGKDCSMTLGRTMMTVRVKTVDHCPMWTPAPGCLVGSRLKE